jgi:hypothetical protein
MLQGILGMLKALLSSGLKTFKILLLKILKIKE